MSVGSVLARGRGAALQLMRDQVTISRLGLPVFDPSTGAEISAGTTIYTGSADVKAMTVAVRDTQAGEQEITLRTYDVRLPFGTVPSPGGPRFLVDDLVSVDECEDPGLEGLVLHVVDPQHGGRRTALHIIAEDRS